jgi:hypothetical protein
MQILICSLLLVLLTATSSFALTPVARVDVVPNQRIEQGATLNFGVVAFSKAGIDRVEFTISGQGYSSGVKTASATTYNPQTRVYEYWVAIPSSEFTTNGNFTVTPIVYGDDADTRNLGATTLRVNATGTLAQPKAWVSTTGNNSTGQVGSRNLPFATIQGAATAIQTAGGGTADGGIIYLMAGTHGITYGSVSTTNEWLTITRDSAATKSTAIIRGTGGILNTSRLKFDGITLTNGTGQVVERYTVNVWAHDCALIGSGQHVNGSRVLLSDDFGTYSNENNPHYFTDVTITNSDYGVHRGILARNVTATNMGNDPFVNTYMVLNARVDNVDPGPTYWHADGYQSWGDAPDNRIVFGYYGTNMHYQGLFLRQENAATIAENNAFVNIFMEMREPGRPGNPGSYVVLSSGTASGRYDHFIMWHCTFVYKEFGIYAESNGHYFTNSSFIGNHFYEYHDYVVQINNYHNPAETLYNNSQGNEYLYNSYRYSAVETGSGSANPPHWYSKSPDSSPTGLAHVVGDPLLNLTDNVTYVNFGAPQSASPLVNSVLMTTVPVDALGNQRTGYPDIGAIEYGGITSSCSASDLGYCLTKLECDAVAPADGEHWYNGICNADPYVETPVCGPTRRDLCLTENDCETTGAGYWWGGLCNAEAEPTPTVRMLRQSATGTIRQAATGTVTQ